MRSGDLRRVASALLTAALLAACSDPTTSRHAWSKAPALAVEADPSDALAPIDLGTLGGTTSHALGVNSLGQVVGVAQTSAGGFRPFLWSAANGMQVLPFGVHASAVPQDVNAAGQVVGNQDRGFIWSAASDFQFLPTLGGQFALAYAINEAGHVVGWSTNVAGFSRAFLWTPSDGMRDLGVLGDGPDFSVGIARGINDRGEVVGQSSTTVRGSYRAFLWTAAAGMRDLGTLGGDFSFALDVNNRGEVVGYALTESGEYHAFLWTATGGMMDLGSLGGASQAWGINDLGEVVGYYEPTPGDYHAFVWTRTGGMRSLGTLGQTSIAVKINNAGLIVGESVNADGFTRAVAWQLSRERQIVIDIKPGSDVNPIKLNEGGQALVPVVVFTTAETDASLIDVGTIRLGTTPVAQRSNGEPFATLVDEDGDGDADLLLHFDRAQLIGNRDLSETTTELILTGRLGDGTAVRGSDAVRVIP